MKMEDGIKEMPDLLDVLDNAEYCPKCGEDWKEIDTILTDNRIDRGLRHGVRIGLERCDLCKLKFGG